MRFLWWNITRYRDYSDRVVFIPSSLYEDIRELAASNHETPDSFIRRGIQLMMLEGYLRKVKSGLYMRDGNRYIKIVE